MSALQLHCDEPVSNFAFNFNLCRYNEIYASSVFAPAADPEMKFVSALAMESTLPGMLEDPMRKLFSDSDLDSMVANQLHVVYGLSKDFCVSGRGLHASTF